MRFVAQCRAWLLSPAYLDAVVDGMDAFQATQRLLRHLFLIIAGNRTVERDPTFARFEAQVPQRQLQVLAQRVFDMVVGETALVGRSVICRHRKQAVWERMVGNWECF